MSNFILSNHFLFLSAAVVTKLIIRSLVYCDLLNSYYLRRFSVSWVVRNPLPAPSLQSTDLHKVLVLYHLSSR